MTETGNGEEPRAQTRHVSKDAPRSAQRKVKFEVYGEEMLEKVVKYSGNSGRVYLPPEWVGKRIKIIRTD
jgi:putative transposon-encoded protein